jgi:DNA-binding transcriptional LysR family regulator
MDMEIGFWGNIAAVTPDGAAKRVVARVPDAFSVLTSVAAGMGVGVLCESLTRIGVPGVVFRRAANAIRSSDHVIVFRKNEGAPAIKTFIAAVRAKARGC